MQTNHSDDHTSELPWVERTVLWSMRAWVVCQQMPAGQVLEKIAATFADLGAPSCANYLDGFMWALRHGAERTIGVDCPCMPTLDPDERTLLRVFAVAQRGDHPMAAALLHRMVSPTGARAAANSAGLLGSELARAGRWMRPGIPRSKQTSSQDRGTSDVGEQSC